MSTNSPILLDNGTYHIKTGYSGSCAPRAVYPSIFGTPRHKSLLLGQSKTEFIGDEAHAKRGILNIVNIFSKGHVIDFDHYEKLLYHNFYHELRAAPEEHYLISSETTGVEAPEREKITQIMLEFFQTAGFFIANDNVVALYASGRTEGLVLNIGEEHSTCTPIYGSSIIPNAVTFGSVAGSQINNFMKYMLKNNHNNPQLLFNRINMSRDIKERVCYVASDYEKEMKNPISKIYELPDGVTLDLTKERFMAPELLFNPELFNIEDEPIQKKIISSVLKSDFSIEKELLGNILLCGGSTMFEGIDNRLNSLLYNHFSKDRKIKIIAPPERKYSVWIGLSILSSLNTFQTLWITQEEYNENGPSFIETKCPSTYSEAQKNQKSFKLDFQKSLYNSSKNADLFTYFY